MPKSHFDAANPLSNISDGIIFEHAIYPLALWETNPSRQSQYVLEEKISSLACGGRIQALPGVWREMWMQISMVKTTSKLVSRMGHKGARLISGNQTIPDPPRSGTKHFPIVFVRWGEKPMVLHNPSISCSLLSFNLLKMGYEDSSALRLESLTLLLRLNPTSDPYKRAQKYIEGTCEAITKPLHWESTVRRLSLSEKSYLWTLGTLAPTLTISWVGPLSFWTSIISPTRHGDTNSSWGGAVPSNGPSKSP